MIYLQFNENDDLVNEVETDDEDSSIADDVLDEVGEKDETDDNDDSVEGFGLVDSKNEDEDEDEEEEGEAELEEDAEDVDYDTFDDIDEM